MWVHILSFHLEFMLACMHLVLAKYVRSTVWYDVDGLCGQFPRRLDELIARGGDRLRK